MSETSRPSPKVRLSRRSVLSSALLGGGGLALRSLATGLSTAFLGEGEASAEPAANPTFLLLATNQDGDPLNVSAPGSMADPSLREAWRASHPAELAPAPVVLGGRSWDAAAPWSKLPPALLARAAFVHHRTFAETHGEHEKVLKVFGAMRGASGNGVEMLPSAIAAELAAALGTIQREPMTLGHERVTYESRFVEQLSPVELKSLFGGTRGKLADFASLRDKTLDAVYGKLKESGTKAQRDYVERSVLSRAQAAKLGEQLAVDLAVVPVNEGAANTVVPGLVEDYDLDAVDQVLTAIALFKYKVTPVVTIHLPFGGDNHQDAGFAQESLEVQGGVRLVQLIWDELGRAGLQDRTTFATLNTFGRTFKATSGRAHNGGHHVLSMVGPKVKPGVVGAPKPGPRDYAAAAFASTTGRVDGTVDVAEDKTFIAAARTLMKATGVPDDRIDARLPGAPTIAAVV